MAWTWRFEKMDGTLATARDLPKETFSSQSTPVGDDASLA